MPASAADTSRAIVITREFTAPRALVWKAWTERDQIAKWWGPRGVTMRVEDFHLKAGGGWKYVMTGPDGGEVPIHGAYSVVKPLEQLVTTAEFKPGFKFPDGSTPPQGLTLDVRFEDLPHSRTRVTITIGHATPEDRRQHAEMGVVAGWQSSLDCLDELLAQLRGKIGTKIFVNLPVRDLKQSITFFEALGYSFNPQFTDDNAACLVISDEIYAMLLTHSMFRGFATKPMVDATKATEVLLALSFESRAQVDEIVRKAVAAGATTPKPAVDHGFMYQHGFDDLDGHVWEVFHMDPNFVQSA